MPILRRRIPVTASQIYAQRLEAIARRILWVRSEQFLVLVEKIAPSWAIVNIVVDRAMYVTAKRYEYV